MQQPPNQKPVGIQKIAHKIKKAFTVPKIKDTLGVFRPAFIRSCLRGEDRQMRRWNRKGRPAPAPPAVKQIVLETYADFYRCPVFIETGTHEGGTPYFLRNHFQQIFTIELSQDYFLRAKRKLEPFKHIVQLQGDSGEQLGGILATVDQPCMFWLDGHYSGGITAKGQKNCPLLEELSHIWRHPNKQHIILLDDARYFGRLESYPSVPELIELGRQAGYDWEIHYDIFCLTPVGAEKLGTRLRQLIK